MSVVIRVEDLAKRYQLGVINRQMLYHEIQSRWARWRGRPDPHTRIDEKNGDENGDFWALNDINFDIHAGEVVGLIGGNGAGKSTLLKILSSITAPTRGRVLLKGTVASLLEVGTGFHPELTGRENVFLNGAILGMRHAEIKRKFDLIVDFAEVGKFIDTPVKRYSSGMYVRLAFAVAAHLSPEILIVDEVLAVGDAAFQKKCLGKMNDVAKDEGRTVIFVSHNMIAIQSLCARGIMLGSSRVVADGPADTVVAKYLRDTREQAAMPLAERESRSGTGTVHFVSVELLDAHGARVTALRTGEQGGFAITLENRSQGVLQNVRVALGIDNAFGQRVTVLDTQLTGENIARLDLSRSLIEIQIEKLPLAEGRYTFTVFAMVNGEIADWVQGAGEFAVDPGDFFQTGKLPEKGQGDVLFMHHFNLLGR